MSKIKLVIAEGYTNPVIGETSVIDPVLKVSDTHNIIGVVRTDFDEDADGSKRVSDDLAPVIHTEGINHLVGKLLTLTEAAFSDQEQRKAFKDLVMQTTWDWYYGNSHALVPAWRQDKFAQ